MWFYNCNGRCNSFDRFQFWAIATGAIVKRYTSLSGAIAYIKVSVTFLAILMTIIIQATTTKWLAGKLGLLVEE